jgi:hypothetical protein
MLLLRRRCHSCSPLSALVDGLFLLYLILNDAAFTSEESFAFAAFGPRGWLILTLPYSYFISFQRCCFHVGGAVHVRRFRPSWMACSYFTSFSTTLLSRRRSHSRSPLSALVDGLFLFLLYLILNDAAFTSEVYRSCLPLSAFADGLWVGGFYTSTALLSRWRRHSRSLLSALAGGLFFLYLILTLPQRRCFHVGGLPFVSAAFGPHGGGLLLLCLNYLRDQSLKIT